MLLIGVAGTELTAQERDWLQHDAVAGVVLFKRNFASRQQVTDLTRRSAPPPAPAADLRGPGRRPRAALPRGLQRAAAAAGHRCAVRHRPQQALALAEQHAWLMASEGAPAAWT
jgi:beta-N-acetylhexosaminidase